MPWLLGVGDGMMRFRGVKAVMASIRRQSSILERSWLWQSWGGYAGAAKASMGPVPMLMGQPGGGNKVGSGPGKSMTEALCGLVLVDSKIKGVKVVETRTGP